jgi:hypothetical protein
LHPGFCADLLLSGGCFALSRSVFTTPPEERGKEGGFKGLNPTSDMAEGRPVCKKYKTDNKVVFCHYFGEKESILSSVELAWCERLPAHNNSDQRKLGSSRDVD